MARRKLLEESPIPSTNEEPVLFDTSEIPWWAWVRRFHLPEVSRPQQQRLTVFTLRLALGPQAQGLRQPNLLKSTGRVVSLCWPFSPVSVNAVEHVQGEKSGVYYGDRVHT